MMGTRLHGAVATAVAMILVAGAACAGQYVQTNLVSDGAIPALHTDSHLVNPWGLASSPTSVTWVANNQTGTSTLYDGNGAASGLVVTVPPAPGSGGLGTPTGVVFSGSATDFPLGGGNPGRFIFASEDGTISGWNQGTSAVVMVDNSSTGSDYKGLALLNSKLYAADFANNRVDVFDSAFAPASLPGAFVDPVLPAGFGPFNVQSIGGSLYVTFARQDSSGHSSVSGAGLGFVDRFDANGNFQARVISGGALDAPWGLAIAPADFGQFSGDLLVGNFGDGKINAYDPVTGLFQGTLADPSDNPIVIDGLWGISFGNGQHSQPANTLFFAAGGTREITGLYGRLDVVPEPSGIGVLLAGLASLAGIRRRGVKALG